MHSPELACGTISASLSWAVGLDQVFDFLYSLPYSCDNLLTPLPCGVQRGGLVPSIVKSFFNGLAHRLLAFAIDLSWELLLLFSLTFGSSIMDTATVGIIGMGEMGRMYARRISAAGWR